MSREKRRHFEGTDERSPESLSQQRQEKDSDIQRHDWRRWNVLESMHVEDPKRLLSTVALDASQKQTFISDVKLYLHPATRIWYANRGIPYRGAVLGVRYDLPRYI